MANLFGGIMTLVLSIILIASVVISTVKTQNTTGWTTGEVARKTTWRLKIPENNWKAEMLIRPEVHTKYGQGQRIGDEKIQFSHEAGTTNSMLVEKIC